MQRGQDFKILLKFENCSFFKLRKNTSDYCVIVRIEVQNSKDGKFIFLFHIVSMPTRVGDRKEKQRKDPLFLKHLAFFYGYSIADDCARIPYAQAVVAPVFHSNKLLFVTEKVFSFWACWYNFVLQIVQIICLLEVSIRRDFVVYIRHFFTQYILVL